MASTFPTLDISKPDATVQTLAQMGQSMRDQETFNRAAAVIGTIPGANMSTTGTEPYYSTVTFARGVEQWRQTITWGTVGGALNNPQTIVYEYSNDSGTTWAKMFSTNGMCTFTYTAAGSCSGTTWS